MPSNYLVISSVFTSKIQNTHAQYIYLDDFQNHFIFRLHLINIQKGISKSPDYVDKFGFDVPTSCGSIPQKNTWHDNWPEYYAFKLEEQIEMIQRDYDDKEVKKLWPILKSKLPTFFEGLNIKPSLLHGDLW